MIPFQPPTTDSVSFSPVFLPENTVAADSIPLLSAATPVGVTADPVPYSTRNDGVLLGLLFVLFLLWLVTEVRAGAFFLRHGKTFFRKNPDRVSVAPDLPSELRYGRLVWLALVIELGLLTHFYFAAVGSVETFRFPRHVVLGLLIVLFAVYYFLKGVMHRFVNWVFFDGKKIEQWNVSRLLLAAFLGILLLPMAFSLPFVEIPPSAVLYFVLFVIIFVKLLSFYKTYLIFFRRFGALLQIFLYFCALELIPLAVLFGFLVVIRDYLQINF